MAAHARLLPAVSGSVRVAKHWLAGVTGELAAADGVGLLDPGFLSRTVRVIAEGTRQASGTLKASKACSVSNEEK